MDPRDIYVGQSAISDPEELIQAFVAWLDFLRDEAGISPERLAAEALELEAAWEHLAGVYNNHHALHLHNLLRNDRFETAIPLARRGLGRLAEAGYAENLDEAVRLYESDRHAWQVPRFAGGSDEYRRAQKVMKPADDRFMQLVSSNDPWKLVADAILKLPTFHAIGDDDLAALRQQILSDSQGDAQAQQDAVEKEARLAEEEVAASLARTQRALKDSVAFAAEMLATGAGYTDVLTLGERHLEEDGSECWFVMLRTESRQAQMNRLVRKAGRFALFDNNMTTLRYSAAETDIELARQKLLGGSSHDPSPPSAFRRIFGRKST
jgi:hypothetical protein